MTAALRTRDHIETYCHEQAHALRDEHRLDLGNGWVQVEHADQPLRDAYSQMRAWSNLGNYGIDDYGSNDRSRRWSRTVLIARLSAEASKTANDPADRNGPMHADLVRGRQTVLDELGKLLRPDRQTVTPEPLSEAVRGR